jgi:hypothetical protein
MQARMQACMISLSDNPLLLSMASMAAISLMCTFQSHVQSHFVIQCDSSLKEKRLGFVKWLKIEECGKHLLYSQPIHLILT